MRPRIEGRRFCVCSFEVRSFGRTSERGGSEQAAVARVNPVLEVYRIPATTTVCLSHSESKSTQMASRGVTVESVEKQRVLPRRLFDLAGLSSGVARLTSDGTRVGSPPRQTIFRARSDRGLIAIARPPSK